MAKDRTRLATGGWTEESGHASLAYCNLTMRRDKSFADDLIAHRGVVSGRVALLLRSTETKPWMPRFVPLEERRFQCPRRPLIEQQACGTSGRKRVGEKGVWGDEGWLG